MENKSRELPAARRLQHRAAHLALTCAIMLGIDYFSSHGLSWSLWAVGGLCIVFLYDLVDYIFIERYKSNE